MKKIFCCIYAVIIALNFSGCEQITEVDNRAIIQLMGVDFENDILKVSMQMYAPNGEKIADSGNIVVNTVVGKGSSIGEAIKDIEYQQGRKPFLGHNYILILGESMLKTDIESVLRVFADDEAIYPGMNVVMAKGSAFDVVNLKIPMGMISARTIDRILTVGEESGYAKQADLAKSIAMLNGESKSTTFPLIKIEDTDGETQGSGDGGKEEKVKMIKMGETIVVDKDKNYFILDKKQTAGLNWITDNITTAVYSCDIDDRPVAITVTKAKTTIKPIVIDNRVVMKTKIDVQIRTSDEASVSLENKEYLEKIQKEISSKIISECNSCVENVLYNNKTDVLNISRYLSAYQPKFFRNNEKAIDNIINSTGFEYEIKCSFYK